MKWDKVLLFVVERVFDVLELIDRANERAKAKRKPKELTFHDLVDVKRDAELLRRTQAPTVVIPPPSERRDSPKRR